MDMAKSSVYALARRTLLLHHHHHQHCHRNGLSKSTVLPLIRNPICRSLEGFYCPRSSIDSSKLQNTRHISCSNSEETIVSPSKATFRDCNLHIYNTMTRQKERFQTISEGKVGIYVCGVTPYDFSHIGHARVYVSFDVLFRYLMHLGYEVKYVRNFTDIDDKIIARAIQLGEDPMKLSDRFCKEFHFDMESLNCLPVTVEPRVTEHIDTIIKLIVKIVENGFAYALDDGDVYFSVDSYVAKYSDYGRLSGREQHENRAGERVTVDKRKRNPADFALWKSAKPGEPSWNSPWGLGRPGWHIECSAMSAKHLGYQFDIHGGGMDLIFPHHENEIAQSCAACHDSSVRYWMHNGFVTIDSEKMSKSLGNFFTIREVLEKYHALAIRLFLVGTHYRSPINYSDLQLEMASDRAYYIYQTLDDCIRCLKASENENSQPSKECKACLERLRASFQSSMSDDLLTPAVLASLSDPLKVMNDLMHTKKGRQDKHRAASLKVLQDEVNAILGVLGLGPQSLPEVLDEFKRKALTRVNLTNEDVNIQIQERAAARAAKDYAKSDNIRKKLASLGIALMDDSQGTTWRPCVRVDYVAS